MRRQALCSCVAPKSADSSWTKVPPPHVPAGPKESAIKSGISNISRRAALVAAVVIGVLGGVQLAAAAPASAAAEVEREEAYYPADYFDTKTKAAYCDPGWRVIGGGGWVQEAVPAGGTDYRKPTLTELRPVRLYNGGTRDAYVVTGAETWPGTPNPWAVQAYAMCAKDSSTSNWVKGVHIVPKTTPSSSWTSERQATAAVCPTGEVVVGTGGKISTSSGRVVLQVARPSHPGDIARIQAREGVAGYGSWYVTAYAVCAPKPPGYSVEFAASENPPHPLDVEKRAYARCPGKRLLSSGAALDTEAPANVSLQRVLPYDAARETWALAVENSWTDQFWDYVLATAVCAD